MIRQVYTIDGRPYDRVQFQYQDGHDGCGLPHAHSNVTVYPFEEWIIRGFPDAPLQTTGDAPLTDPDPEKCGFGADISLKNPPNVFVQPRQLREPCARIEVDRIDTASELEARNLSQWTDLCDSLGG